MAEAVLVLLLRQSVVLGLTLALLLLLRPLLLRLGGAGLAYAAWALLPLLMWVASLPGSAPALALTAAVWAEGAVAPRLAGVPLPRLDDGIEPIVCLLLWACGVLAGLLRLTVLHVRYVRSLRPAAEAGHRWGPAGSGPALVGWLRPRLVLPMDFAQRFSPQQQTLVRCHEAVHQQRHDNAWNLLATGLCLLHWFNPLAWWALRRMRADQELACDAAVMAHHPGSQAAYGHALLQAQGVGLPISLPWSRWSSVHPLTERIAMLKRAHVSPIARRAGGLLLLLLGLASAGAVHAWRAGELRAEASPAAAPDAAAAAAEGMVDVAMELSMHTRKGDSSQHMQGRPSMRLQQGKEGRLIMNGTPDQPTPEQVVITLKATALSGGRWQLDLHVAQGLPLQTLAQPRLIVMEGEPGRIEVGGDPSSRQLSLAITARRASAALPAAVPAKT